MYQNEDDLERELRDGLRLRDAPEGFAARLAARAATGIAGDKAGRLRLTKRPSRLPYGAEVMRWAVAAALLTAVGLGGYSEHQRRQRMEQAAGERAREQVLLALRITSSTLQAVHDKVIETGR